MSASQVVVLLVALGGAREPSTHSMLAATQAALDPDALVLVREVPDATLASDARAIGIADTVHADAVAVLTWPDADHHRAHVHVYAARPTRWVDRDIEFRDVDAAEERGKALGYAVAAMVLPRHERPPTPPPAPAVTAPPMPEPAPPAPAAPSAPPPASPLRTSRIAIDLSAVGSAGVSGNAGGFGSEAGLRWRFYGPLSFRVGGGLRLGEVTTAGASSLVWRGDAGFAWRVVTLGDARPVALGLRADFVMLEESLARPTIGGGTSDGSRWQPAGDGLLEVAWAFVPQAAIVAAGGAEVAAGATAVLVDDQPVATIPRVRILGEFGIRVFL